MVTRASWKLGQAIAGDRGHSPDVIGVAVMGLLDRAWYVERATMAGERVMPLDQVDPLSAPYFSMVVIPSSLAPTR